MVTTRTLAARACRRLPLVCYVECHVRASAAAAHVRDPHLRLPDERARLRAARWAARRGGLPPRRRRRIADVVVFNTCAVRENADNRLYGSLGQSAAGQEGSTRHADRGRWLPGPEGPGRDRPPGALGRRGLRHPQHRVAAGAAGTGPDRAEAQVEIKEALETFPSKLPTRRESAYAAWVSISVGCNNTCTFCIVPALRGRETDRRPGDILAEIGALVAEGVQEVTLLGQNVNAYGVEFGDRSAFAKLLRACGEIDGLERVRFTSPHPKDFTDDVIAAMAETPNVMPQLHMPLQSGSDAVLARDAPLVPQRAVPGHHRQGAGRDAGGGHHHRHHRGFPGETEQDFQATLDVVAAARFAAAFTFQYSIRPGTPAATMADQMPKAVVQERYERLVDLVGEICLAGEPAPGRPARSR